MQIELDKKRVPKYKLLLFSEFYQQMHSLLNIHNVKIYTKISYNRSYMFRSILTILRELILSLSKVTL